jgi:hypothetical protein
MAVAEVGVIRLMALLGVCGPAMAQMADDDTDLGGNARVASLAVVVTSVREAGVVVAERSSAAVSEGRVSAAGNVRRWTPEIAIMGGRRVEVEYAMVPVAAPSKLPFAKISATGDIFDKDDVGITAGHLADGAYDVVVSGLRNAAKNENFRYKIDLGSNQAIGEIVLWTRQDGKFPERLSNLRVVVLCDTAARGCESGERNAWARKLYADGTHAPAGLGTKVELDVGGATGRWIVVRAREPMQFALQLSEIEVWPHVP